MSEHLVPIYHFLADKDEMKERLKIWHKGFLDKGLTVDQSKTFLLGLYLKCDEAFGWSQITYSEMVERAINT